MFSFILTLLFLLIMTEIEGFRTSGENSPGCEENFMTRVKAFGVT